MEIFLKVIICLIAGIGAGVGTGFAGMSAAAVIGPMLMTFLDVPAYTAVGVGLASDVLASAISAYTYKKNKNIDIKNGIVMMICVLAMTVVGSWVSSKASDGTMGTTAIVAMLFIGLRFLIKPVMTTKEAMQSRNKKKQMIKAVIAGCSIGFTCGFVGAGGGMMMLFCLTSVLGYELKTAVGTSVFVMAFTALTGAVSHFTMGGMPDTSILIMCVCFTLVFARISAKLANKAKPATLNRVVGIVLIVMAVSVLTFKLITKFNT